MSKHPSPFQGHSVLDATSQRSKQEHNSMSGQNKACRCDSQLVVTAEQCTATQSAPRRHNNSVNYESRCQHKTYLFTPILGVSSKHHRQDQSSVSAQLVPGQPTSRCQYATDHSIPTLRFNLRLCRQKSEGPYRLPSRRFF